MEEYLFFLVFMNEMPDDATTDCSIHRSELAVDVEYNNVAMLNGMKGGWLHSFNRHQENGLVPRKMNGFGCSN